MQTGLGFWMSVIFSVQCLTALTEVSIKAKKYSHSGQVISSATTQDGEWRSTMANQNDKQNNSFRDNAEPTGTMSAEESHQYAQQFQKENFGDSSNIGEGRNAGADATTQATLQKHGDVPAGFDDKTKIDHQADEVSQRSDKNKPL